MHFGGGWIAHSSARFSSPSTAKFAKTINAAIRENSANGRRLKDSVSSKDFVEMFGEPRGARVEEEEEEEDMRDRVLLGDGKGKAFVVGSKRNL